MTKKLVLAALFAAALILVCCQSYAQDSLAPDFMQTFLDNNGQPCAGCFVYSYSAGTSTPLATYTSSTGGAQNTNPIVLNAYGRPSNGVTETGIWLGSNSYKFILKDADGVTIKTVDNVNNLWWLTQDLTVSGNWHFTGIVTFDDALINGGAINNTPIGRTTQSYGRFSYVSINLFERDCRQDGVTANGTTDDSTALNSCIANAYAAQQGTVTLPCGQIKINSAINASNINSLTIRGCGTNQTYGGDFGSAMTSIICNTGGTCIDKTGSSYLTLEDFQIRSATSQTNPGVIGIFEGRTTTNANTLFSQFNTIQNVNIYLDTIPAANGGTGTIAIYNVASEHANYFNSKLIADECFDMAATNVRTLTPPYHTLGGAASMSTARLGNVSCSAWTGNAFQFWKTQDVTMTRSHCLNNGTSVSCLTFNDQNEGLNLEIQVESYTSTHAFTFNNADNTHINIDAEIVSPATTIAVFQNSAGLSDSVWRIFQKNGTPQSLFTAGTSTFIKGGAIYATNLANINASTMTITGTLVHMPDLASSSVTLAAASQFDFVGSDGQKHFGTISTIGNCSGVGTAASPSVASCGSAVAGSFSCATNASTATCTVNTTAVTANSQILVQEDETLGTKLGVTCNTSTTVIPTSRLLAARVAGTSFTINLGTVTTNPACFSYLIVN
jgi:hypothetical protein